MKTLRSGNPQRAGKAAIRAERAARQRERDQRAAAEARRRAREAETPSICFKTALPPTVPQQSLFPHG